jgi:flagellar biosynthesis protein FlhF
MGSEAASMRIKSYFASSVERAIHDAREELGGEATLITSRRAAPDARHLGAYEVVFGIAEAPEDTQSAIPSEEFNAELTMLRDQLDGIKRLLKLKGAAPESFARPELGRLYEQLLSAGWEAGLAREITEDASAGWQALAPAQRSTGASVFEGLAAECIGTRLRFAPQFTSPDPDSNRAVILAGPPGAGKTSTLAKIAIQECLARRLSIRIISVDLHRVAAHEKLRSFATLMGAGFTAASTAAEFMEAVDEFRNKSVLLIDTPGYGHGDWEFAHDLAQVLAQLKHKQVHLVLPASMHTAGLRRYIRRYDEFNPEYLLFTKLDETESYGSMLSVAIEAAKPLSFLTRGQSIPEDLEGANSGVLLAGLFARERAEAISAA